MFYKFSKEQQTEMLTKIQQYYELELGEEISSFAAERLLEFFKESLGPHFYNAGIRDAQTVVQSLYSSIDDELLSLEKSIRK